MSALRQKQCDAERRPLVVLLAEDNLSHAKLVLRGLQDSAPHKQVFHVRDGEAALDYLLRRGQFTEPQASPRPDLVLLDLRLPKIDGFGVLERIKSAQHLLDIPIVVLSTSSADVDVTRAYQLRANSYLVKPDEFDVLLNMMNELGRYWLTWNEPPLGGR